MNIRLLFIAVSLFFIACNNNTKNTEQSDSKTTSDSEIIKGGDSNSLSVDTTQVTAQMETEQLVPKHILTNEDLYRDYDNGNDLSKFFKIEVISKDTFLTHLSSAVNCMVYDSSAVNKNKGISILPLKHGKLRLEDKIADNDSHREYKYIGQLKALDMYLVLEIFEEEWAYILFDKNNGNRVQSFIGQPYLSVNKQYVIYLDLDSVEGIATIGLYGVTNNEVINKKYIDPIVEMYVKSWVPYTQKYSMFWDNDGYFYVPVIYSDNFLDAQNNFYGLDQYIRILPIAS